MSQHVDFSHQSMGDTKYKITEFVEAYKSVFKQEYLNFLDGQKPKVNEIQEHNKLAKIKGSEVIEFQMGEMPETLFVLLERNLTPEEYVWYQTKAGQKWFYNTFKEFKVTGGRL